MQVALGGVEGVDEPRGHGGPGFEVGDAVSEPGDLGRLGAQLTVLCLELSVLGGEVGSDGTRVSVIGPRVASGEVAV
ncbi:hypothetical protein [Gordonia sp. SMJS1]|uniref:hypothetical protein n=1 Tax=Gordonia sp. SMJS1 TaxID=3039400 RepID=UPI0024588CE6|nr:hypothetical protein [Gordonia sp. SMJS1]WGJ88300.1 hypothetical protein QAD21_24855 [Gordonia sp. SMJS1]